MNAKVHYQYFFVDLSVNDHDLKIININFLSDYLIETKTVSICF